MSGSCVFGILWLNQIHGFFVDSSKTYSFLCLKVWSLSEEVSCCIDGSQRLVPGHQFYPTDFFFIINMLPTEKSLSMGNTLIAKTIQRSKISGRKQIAVDGLHWLALLVKVWQRRGLCFHGCLHWRPLLNNILYSKQVVTSMELIVCYNIL